MMNDGLSSASSRILPPGALPLVLDREIQNALGSRIGVSLITLTVERAGNAAADAQNSAAVGEMVEQAMRERDLVGYLEPGLLALIMRNSDYPRAKLVANRLVADIENGHIPAAINVTVGAACCPTHANSSASLAAWAVSHPLASCRSGTRASVRRK